MICTAYKGDRDEISEISEEVALKVSSILDSWDVVPGVVEDGTFNSSFFETWMNLVKQLCESTGHIEIAQSLIGALLVHAPDDTDLWIHKAIARELNIEENSSMRSAYSSELYNSRGAYIVDPTGAPETALARGYRNKAKQLDEHGFSRLAATLRMLADSYEREILMR